MSDTSQGPGWWLASDGKWYPPELWTGPPGGAPGDPTGGAPQPQTPTPGYPTQPGYPTASVLPGQPTTSPQWPTAGGYGAAPYPASGSPGPYPAYGQPGQPGPYAGYQPYSQSGHTKNNGLAIAALVCGCAGFVYFIPAVLAIVFGFVARAQIRNSGGAQKGRGMALAGIIVGFSWIAVLILIIVLVAVFGSNNDTNDGLVSPVALMLQLHLGVHAH